MKSDPDLRSIPVIMLSSSVAMKDVDVCYREHANAYIQKPMELERYLEVLRATATFWADVAVAAGPSLKFRFVPGSPE